MTTGNDMENSEITDEMMDQLELCPNIECDGGIALEKINGIATTQPIKCPECNGRGFKKKLGKSK